MGIWRKFGEYLYISMFFFFTVLFGDFEQVRDGQDPSHKETSSVFCHVFYTSKYLRVMELRDTKFMVRGRPIVPLEQSLVSVGSTWY